MPAVQQTPDLAEGVEPERGPKARHNNWQSLKSHREPFQLILARQQRAEFRYIGDRVFHVGEMVNLHEWDHEREEYTGDFASIQILAIEIGPDYGIPEKHAVLSIALRAWATDPPTGARELIPDTACPVCLRPLTTQQREDAAASGLA